MNGLIRDAVDLGLQHAIGQLRQRRQVQIREKDQAGPQMIVFGGLRLFHLDHQVGSPPDLRRRGQNRRARFGVLAVRERAASARGGLDQNLVPGLAQRRHAAGHQAHACLMIFHFFGNANNHCECSSNTWC